MPFVDSGISHVHGILRLNKELPCQEKSRGLFHIEAKNFRMRRVLASVDIFSFYQPKYKNTCSICLCIT